MPQTIPCTMNDVNNFLGGVGFSMLEFDAIKPIILFMEEAGFAPGKFNRDNLTDTPQSLFEISYDSDANLFPRITPCMSGEIPLLKKYIRPYNNGDSVQDIILNLYNELFPENNSLILNFKNDEKFSTLISKLAYVFNRGCHNVCDLHQLNAAVNQHYQSSRLPEKLKSIMDDLFNYTTQMRQLDKPASLSELNALRIAKVKEGIKFLNASARAASNAHRLESLVRSFYQFMRLLRRCTNPETSFNDKYKKAKTAAAVYKDQVVLFKKTRDSMAEFQQIISPTKKKV